MQDLIVLIVLALIALIAFKEYLSYKERKDNLDRLMAKNLQEYKDNTISTPNDYGSPTDDSVVPVEEMEDELVNGDEEPV